MNLLSAVGNSVESVFTFTATNCCIYYAYDKVQKSLQEAITQVAMPHIGNSMASFVGTHVSILASLPVTLCIADVATFAIKESVHSIASMLGVEVLENPKPRLWQNICSNVSVFAIGFFAKAYFCWLAMEPIAQGLQQVLPFASPTGAIVIIAAPAITLMLGDLLSMGVSMAARKICICC